MLYLKVSVLLLVIKKINIHALLAVLPKGYFNIGWGWGAGK